ncbi:hypothetical protein B0H17DRAFT_1112636 [Mycena rosella]|uniref:MYND-type domain-containing protein n=1 Tax=Mycena rosella TaxID=1033263 RepID=A0AAD7BII3_MYCRO|nr:hypothetical protein B0H17DRAFT_1112636 [Mycena rosella]
MPGSGKKSSTRKETLSISTRRDRTDGTGDKAYEDAPVRFCSRDQCFNYHNLKQCGRCMTAAYCSVECQQKSWKQHKPVCQYNSGQFELADGEPLLQRNLRHWVARFDATLLSACIRGLNLKFEWERINHGGLVIFLEPRPHPNVGSRWSIRNAGMFRNEGIMNILEKVGMAEQYRDQVLPLHNVERERLRKSSGGRSDYVSVFMLADNIGPNALEGDHTFTMRFKPVDMHQSMVALLPMDQYAGDWCQDLKDQVHNDHPLKHSPAHVMS